MGAFKEMMVYFDGNSEAKENKSFSSLPKPCNMMIAGEFLTPLLDGRRLCSNDKGCFCISEKKYAARYNPCGTFKKCFFYLSNAFEPILKLGSQYGD